MKERISLIGSGQTRFGEWWDKSLVDLMSEAVDRAFEDAPCTALDVDMVIVANMLAEQISGQAHVGALAAALLPHRPPALRVESACASGAVALHTACAMLESGRAQTVLVVGAEKMTDVSGECIAQALMGAADSEKDAPSGLTFPGIFGLIAQRYMHEYGLTREALNCVSAYHHAQAVHNPFAQFRQAIAPAKVSASPLVADPLCMLDCSPISDGAAAVLLSTRFTGTVSIRASQLSTDTVSITQRPVLTSFSASREAAAKALGEAGLAMADIDCVELHDCFSIAAVISVEDLGLAQPGEGIGCFMGGQSVAINRSGGLKACGHPVAATGIKQVAEVSRQLCMAGQRFGLTHNFGGACATCGVHILEHHG